MCRIQSVCNLDTQIEHGVHFQRLAIDQMPKSLSLQQFHCDEGSLIGLVNLVDRADVRVIQRGGSLGFPLETAKSLCIVGKIIGKEFQSHMATELNVLSLIDDAHASSADLSEDAVMR